jgi:hypothetical protein
MTLSLGAKDTIQVYLSLDPFIQVYIWLEKGSIRMEGPFLFFVLKLNANICSICRAN